MQICHQKRLYFPSAEILRSWMVATCRYPFLVQSLPTWFLVAIRDLLWWTFAARTANPIHLDLNLHRFITLHWIQVVMVKVSPGSGEWVPSRQVAIYNRATIQLLWKFFQTACRSYVRVFPTGLRGWSFPDFHHPSILFIIYMIFSILFHHLLIMSCPYSFTSPFTIIVVLFHIVSYHFICRSYTSHIHFIYTSYALHSVHVSCHVHFVHFNLLYYFMILSQSCYTPFVILL